MHCNKHSATHSRDDVYMSFLQFPDDLYSPALPVEAADDFSPGGSYEHGSWEEVIFERERGSDEKRVCACVHVCVWVCVCACATISRAAILLNTAVGKRFFFARERDCEKKRVCACVHVCVWVRVCARAWRFLAQRFVWTRQLGRCILGERERERESVAKRESVCMCTYLCVWVCVCVCPACVTTSRPAARMNKTAGKKNFVCVYMYVFVRVYVCIYIHVCMYIYVCTHTHTQVWLSKNSPSLLLVQGDDDFSPAVYMHKAVGQNYFVQLILCFVHNLLIICW